MDAPIASAGLQPAPHRPVELDRVRPQAPTAASGGRMTSDAPPSFADKAAGALESRLTSRRSVERDPTTNALVYRLVDLSTGIVTVQTPTDARLRLRAYIDGVLAGPDAPSFEARA